MFMVYCVWYAKGITCIFIMSWNPAVALIQSPSFESQLLRADSPMRGKHQMCAENYFAMGSRLSPGDSETKKTDFLPPGSSAQVSTH